MRYLLYLILLLSIVLADNPYHVDVGSISKGDYKWTMNILHDGKDKKDNPIAKGSVTIESMDRHVLHLKIVDANRQRWEAPMFNPNAGKNYQKQHLNQMGVELFTKAFGIKVTDPHTKELVVDSSKGSLQFKDKYLEITMKFYSQLYFGLGERVTEDFILCAGRNACYYTLWGKDEASPIDDGTGGCKGDYGQQPFYMMMFQKSKKFMGVYVHNSNDQDVHIQKYNDGSSDLTHRLVGGVFDIYFFYPGNAEFVMQNYHELIGRPYLIPYWSLGYHQCRYGWKNLNKVKDVVTRFTQNNLPLDVVWADIDYMNGYADFTVDPINYAGLKEFVRNLHKDGMRWVPIIDAGLKYDPNDKYFKYGEKHNAFIKSAFTKKTLIGKVWPGYAVFISWYSPYGEKLWWMGLNDLYELVEYDGIWIDMNEVSNFCHGECREKEMSESTMLRRLYGADPHDPKEFDNIPYRPGDCNMTEKTISMTGYHYSNNDFNDRVLKEYNTHSIWNVFEAKATHEFLADKLKQRPFVLTRSNFPGSGLYTTKWLGDNFSLWEHMRNSIPGMFNYQMFGIPLIGADMCGFVGNTTEELCGRWMQLGAFNPFTRNHNAIGNIDQEPYVFGERVMMATRNAMRQKYSIMHYYYTKMFEASLNGGSVIRPLFFEFPHDAGAFAKRNYMFMIGSALLVAPVLHQGAMNSYPYCTNEDWYHLMTMQKVFSYDPTKTEGDQITLPDRFDYVNVLIIGGNIIPYQETSTVRRIITLKNLPIIMLIVPDHNGIAKGTMVMDDGISLDTIKKMNYKYLSFSFSMSKKKLVVKQLKNINAAPLPYEMVTTVTVMGASKLSSNPNACLIATNGDKVNMRGFYNQGKDTLTYTVSKSGIEWKQVNYINFLTSC